MTSYSQKPKDDYIPEELAFRIWIFNYFIEYPKRCILMRFGVNKKDGCAARTWTWGIIYNPETLCFEKVKSSLRAFHPKPNMCQSVAAAFTVNFFCTGDSAERGSSSWIKFGLSPI